MLVQQNSSPEFVMVNPPALAGTGPANILVYKNGVSNALAGTFSSAPLSSTYVTTVTLAAGDTDTIGDLVLVTVDSGGNPVAVREFEVVPYDPATGPALDAAALRAAVGLAAADLDTQLAAITAGLPNAAAIRAAVGLAVSNLDTQLAAIAAAEPTASAIRAAIGEASANLDTQLAAIATECTNIATSALTAASVRSAIGEASANLDAQLAVIEAAIPNNASIRAAVGLAAANLDAQLGAISPLNADGIRAAVGLAAANLDTQLHPLSQVNAIATATGRLPNVPAAAGDAMNLTVAYDKAKTAAQPGDQMTLTAAYDAAKTCAQPGQAVTLGGSNLNALGASLATLAQLPGLPWYVQQQLKITAELLEMLPH